MYIVIIGWAYVVLMMSISEESIVAGIMTFLLYGVLPLSIIIYLSGTRHRRARRAAREMEKSDSASRGSAPASVDAPPPAPSADRPEA